VIGVGAVVNGRPIVQERLRRLDRPRTVSVVGFEQPVVIGRRRELGVIEAFLTRAADGAAALAVRGPAGIGKTTVWQAGGDLAAERGWRVLAARPAGVEASLSFAGLVDLFAHVDDAALDDLPPPQRRALAAALLREDPADGRIDRRALATGTATALLELARAEPVLVAVDDAQWLDTATVDALSFALRRVTDAGIGVLCSIRTGTGVPDTFETALPEDRRADLELRPLTVAAMHEVIRARLGRSLPRPTVVRIVERTAGNAFYALEIARELVRREDDTPGQLPVPASAQELVRLSVGRLPRETRDALLLASALAAPTTAVAAAEAFEPAEQAGVVRLDASGRIQFEHPLLAAALYESVSAARRRDVHRQLVDLSGDPETRARHLALAADGPDEAVAAELDAAATHTAARGASAAAGELARLALQATPRAANEARARRTLLLAHYLLDAGESAGSRTALEAFDATSVDGDLRAELLRDRGYGLWYEGERDAGYRLVLDALEHASDDELAARTHAAAAWLWHDGDLDRAIEHADAAVGLLDPEQHPGPYSWSLLLGTYLRLLNGDGDDEAAYRRGRELQKRPIDWDDTSPVLGMWPLLHDRFAEAQSVYEVGLERARSEGDVTSVQGTLVRLAEIACWTGDAVEADRLADECMALADRTSSSTQLGGSLYARGLVDAHLGRLDEARVAGEEIVATFGTTTQGALLGHWLLGFVSLSLADPATADREYTRAQTIVDAQGQREPARYRFQPDHIEAVIELGDVARAREMLARLEQRAAVFPRPWALATNARCRALVAAAEGDLTAAGEAAAEALVQHEQLAMPFERARTLLVQGRILRRLKQKREARAALDQALAEFERLGDVTWARTTAAELRRLATRRAPDALTPTERRIAELAASGLSNPEISARVYVSRKTVEANLARAYRKLGISSRAQLGQALAGEAEPIS
jgi:DNA-binding CsgD family transcriptional regulator